VGSELNGGWDSACRCFGVRRKRGPTTGWRTVGSVSFRAVMRPDAMRRLAWQLFRSESISEGKCNRELLMMNPIMKQCNFAVSWMKYRTCNATERSSSPNSMGSPYNSIVGSDNVRSEREREKGNVWDRGTERAMSCERAGTGVRVPCVSNGVVLVAPQAAKPWFTAPIYKIWSSATPLDRVCCLGLNCRLAIPILVKG
jgi:hypothetical protein